MHPYNNYLLCVRVLPTPQSKDTTVGSNLIASSNL